MKEKRLKTKKEPYVATTDSCKLCAPLGACLAFKGVESSVPFLHGSQGCATYMRRYVISHFREPLDIASSSLGEKHAIYGGGPNLKLGLKNVMAKYHCGLIGVATTCLTETIGDDTPRLVKEFRNEFADELECHGNPSIVNVSTPSYAGSHVDGFHSAVRAIVDQLASNVQTIENTLNLFPGFVSPADIRYLKEIVYDFGLNPVVLPDISETLDGPAAAEYEKIPSGGTPIASIKGMGTALSSIEFGRCLDNSMSAANILEDRFNVRSRRLGTPIGLRETDIFMNALEEITCRKTPVKYELERGRLIDSYVDGHKYVSGKRAVIYGDPDMVVGLASFLTEIGIKPVLCATGAKCQHFKTAIKTVTEEILDEPPEVLDDVDFLDIEETAEKMSPDVLIGSSKGYKLARKWNIPLVRLGFPIHDRFGAQRICQLGYKGTQDLFDMIVNAVIQATQDRSPIGYTYI
ncbi:MAG: nitrogenase component 1 [Desulfomonilaceae bacterium]